MRFVGSLMFITTCEFYYDDVVVTSCIDIKFGDVTNKFLP